MPPIFRLLIFLAIVVAVATASYYLLERPLSKIRPGKRNGTPLTPPTAAPAPA